MHNSEGSTGNVEAFHHTHEYTKILQKASCLKLFLGTTQFIEILKVGAYIFIEFLLSLKRWLKT